MRPETQDSQANMIISPNNNKAIIYLKKMEF